jgi:hypothetical protein
MASQSFFQNIQPIVKSPILDTESWADEVEAASQSELGSQREAPEDDGFTTVNRRKGNNKGNNKPAKQNSKPRGGSQLPPDTQHWHQSTKKRPAGRGGAQQQGRPPASRTGPVNVIIIDPRPVPEAPSRLSVDAKIVYNLIRKLQPEGGVSSRRMTAILSEAETVRTCGLPFDTFSLGDILYDELEVLRLVYKQGGQGGKWKINSDIARKLQ